MVGSTQTQTRTRSRTQSRTQSRVTADVVLPLSAQLAADRLAHAFHTADRDGQLLMIVGPGRRSRLVGKQVRATLTRERRRGSTEVFGLHWEPVGPAAAAYPTLDARLGVTPVDVASCLLSVVASYRPPLGVLGATADRAAMSRVAAATVASALHELADAITHPSRPLAAGRIVRSVTS